MTFFLLSALGFCFFIIAALGRKALFAHKESDALKEILETSPYGLFLFLPAKGKRREAASNKLSLLVKAQKKIATFDDFLAEVDHKSQDKLKRAVDALLNKEKHFTLHVSSAFKSRSLIIYGSTACTLKGAVFAHILWVEDITDLDLKNTQMNTQIKALTQRDELLEKALDALPFPLWLRNEDSSLAYCNQAYAKLANAKNKDDAVINCIELNYKGDTVLTPKVLAIAAKRSKSPRIEKASLTINGVPTMLEIHEIPLSLFTLGLACDINEKEELKESLLQQQTAQYQFLSSLASGVALFDAHGTLKFYNKAYADLWKLDEDWLDTHPSFSAILDRLRDKRLLPETGNFLNYKKMQMDLFQNLNQPMENILHLPTGQILKRMMHPFASGDVALTYDDVTDRVSLERSYNEQLVTQHSILNQLKVGILVFDAAQRVRLFNKSFLTLFHLKENAFANQPLLTETLEILRPSLSQSDDIWDLLKQKILLAVENRKTLPLTLLNGDWVAFKTSPLPDGGIRFIFERN